MILSADVYQEKETNCCNEIAYFYSLQEILNAINVIMKNHSGVEKNYIAVSDLATKGWAIEETGQYVILNKNDEVEETDQKQKRS